MQYVSFHDLHDHTIASFTHPFRLDCKYTSCAMSHKSENLPEKQQTDIKYTDSCCICIFCVFILIWMQTKDSDHHRTDAESGPVAEQVQTFTCNFCNV